MTRLAIVSSKECWQDETGAWWSYGGFPRQMDAVASLFDEVTMLVVRSRARAGGAPLPAAARVIAAPEPPGQDARRKLFVAAALPYYVALILRAFRGAAVVHVPLPGDIPFLALAAAILMRKRCIARYGGSWTANGQTTAMNRLTRACMRRAAGGRNVMLATGDDIRPPASGVEWVFATAMSGDELARIRPRFQRGLSSPPRLVYVGRLSVEKGVEFLVSALARLRSDGVGPLPHLTLAGDGPQRPALEDRVRAEGIEPHVTFAGQLSRDALSCLLTESDVCVQPSLTEGFSKAWLDAMAHGVPVLTTTVGASAAVIGSAGERGWTVPPGDVRALADRLRAVLAAEDVDWPALRRRCRAYVESRTLEAWAERIGAICVRQWGGRLEDGKLAL